MTAPEPKPLTVDKTEITVEALALNEDESDWTLAEIWIQRDWGEEELRFQSLIVNKEEFEAIFRGMFLQRNDSIWSHRTVTHD